MHRCLTITFLALAGGPIAAADDPYQREFENIADDDDLLIGAYYYPWYGADGRHWDDGVPRMPSLGKYDSTDELTISRHIDWATGHGIDFFAVSWWGPGSFEDDAIRSSFLAADLSHEIGFAIMYESTGRLEMRNDRIDLDSPHNRERLAADWDYLATRFFDDPNYLRIDGRPVVFVYLSRIMTGDVAAAFNAAREACGDDVYIIGDEVYWQEPSVERLQIFDGVTAYNMHTSSPDVAQWFVRELIGKYHEWDAASSEADVLFVPSVIPGFDDTAVRPQARHPVIPRSPELFGEQLDLALDLADDDPRLVMVNSWNEWHEDTAIEPADDYEFEYLRTLRNALESP